MLGTLLFFRLRQYSSDRFPVQNARDPSRDTVSKIREKPCLVGPTADFADYVDVEALGTILDRLRPLSPKPMVSVGMAVHALRLWGVDAAFPNRPLLPHCLSQQMWQFSSWRMLDILLDDVAFSEMYPNSEPLLSRSEHGIAVRLKVGHFADLPITRWPDCEPHVDKLLSVLGEIGIPSTAKVVARGRDGTVADLLRDSLARFSIDQELEFTCKAFLYYLDSPYQWTTRYDQTVSLDTILEKLARTEIEAGACVGTHKYQVLTLALRINETKCFLSTDTQELLETRMRDVVQCLEVSQTAAGGWPPDWSLSGSKVALVEAEGAVATALRVTGHHLEWIAIAPSSLRPRDQVIIQAIGDLQKTMVKIPTESYYQEYQLLTHAARALVLLSQRDSFQVLSAQYKLH